MMLVPIPVPQGRLGQTEQPVVNEQVWNDYLKALRDSTMRSWERTRSAYMALKAVREGFGLPLVAAPGEAPSPGALSPGENQDFVYVAAVAELLAQWADEALAGNRRVVYNAQTTELEIELLSSDTTQIVVENEAPRIVDVATGDPVPVSGTVEGPAIAPILFGVAAVAAVAAAGVYFTTDRVAKALETTAEQKTMDTIAAKQADLVEKGIATPEEARRLTGALFQGASELKDSKTEEKKEKTGWQQTITTVAWVGLGVAGVLTLGKIVPAALGTGSGRC